MSAAWMRGLIELRRRWRVFVALGLVGGLLFGAAIAAAAGARRTWSAYPRFVDRYVGYTISIGVGGYPNGAETLDALARLPDVEASWRVALFIGAVVLPNGTRVSFPDVFMLGQRSEKSSGVIGSKILSGRAPAADRADEAVVNYAFADHYALKPGDELRAYVAPPGFSGEAPGGADAPLRIVGTYAAAGQFETLSGSSFRNNITVSDAFVERYQRYADVGNDLFAVRLRDGEVGIPAFRRELKTLASKDLKTDGEGTLPTDTIAGVQGLNRLPSSVLWALAGLLAIAGTAVVAQSIGRELSTTAEEQPTLGALGMTKGERLVASMTLAGAVSIVGALVAVPAAWLMSPLTPVGLARIAEPDPGRAFDSTAIILGALIAALGVGAAALVPARRHVRTRRDRPTDRPSVLASALARVSAPASVVTGVRMAFEPGRGRSAVPVHTAMLGSALAVAALIASVTVGASLDRMLSDPKIAGYSWDAEVASDPGELPRVARAVGTVPGVRRTWRANAFQMANLEGSATDVITAETPSATVISEGRAPVADDEVALSATALRVRHKRIGDRVSIASLTTDNEPDPSAKSRRFTIVGRFVYAHIAFESDRVGEALSLTPEGLRSLAPFDWSGVYIEADRGTDLARLIADLRRAAGPTTIVLSREEVGSVSNFRRIADLPLALGILLAFIAAAVVTHALYTTVRRRRHDLAILKTLGFLGRQVRATVAWEATAFIALAVMLGIPTGVIVGRWAWRLYIERLGLLPVPVVPVLMTMLIVPAALIIANLVAALPARAAARTPAALVLRTE
jgi:putative ABC transport system permease protein